jgi:hypothetical protein
VNDRLLLLVQQRDYLCLRSDVPSDVAVHMVEETDDSGLLGYGRNRHAKRPKLFPREMSNSCLVIYGIEPTDRGNGAYYILKEAI